MSRLKTRRRGWYVARLRAMSARELAWRGSSEVRRRVPSPRPELREMEWDTGGWAALVRDLAGGSRDRLVEDARRIAAGELRFWGRDRRIDPQAPPWREGPFAADLAAGASWAADPKCRWELRRQQHLFTLAAGGHLAGEPAWTRLCVDQMLDWLARRPPADEGSAAGYEAAHRLVSWSWALPFTAGAASEEERTRIGEALAAEAALVHRRPSRYSSANNHRLAELVGLLAFEAVCVERTGWDEVWSELEDELVRQTFPDGGSREQAAGYFLYVLEIVWAGMVYARAVGRDLGRVADRAERALEWLRAIGDADEEPPPFGDDAEDRFVRVDYFRDRRAAALAARVRALLDGAPVLDADTATPRRSGSTLLHESGYVVMRGGPPSRPARVVLDAGPLGLGSLAAHGHADALAVTIAAGSQTLLRDSGTGTYLPSAGRDAFRLTSAHNTVSVNGRSQAHPQGPHLWGRRFTTSLLAVELGGEAEYVRATHDGYRPEGAEHVRSVACLRPDLVVVLDRVTAARPCTAELRWQTMPGRPLESPGAGAAAAVASLPAAERLDDDGPYSPRYTWLATAPRATFRATGSDIVFATVVALSGERVGLTVRQEGDATIVEVDAGRRLRLVERWSGGAPSVVVR